LPGAQCSDVADIKGFSQLYQHTLGADFFGMQHMELLEVSSGMQEDSFSDAVKRDIAFLSGHHLVDYSLLIFRHPSTSSSSTGHGLSFDRAGAKIRSEDHHEYSIAFIDVLSELVDDRIKSSDERGRKFRLPCGKFSDYGEQIQDMIDLVIDKDFGHLCARRVAEARDLAQLSDATSPARKVVKRMNDAIAILVRIEDLVALRLIAKYCSRRAAQPLSDVQRERLLWSLEKPCASAPGLPLWHLADEALLPEDSRLFTTLLDQ